MTNPSDHTKITSNLASQLSPKDIYDWLMTVGYFPENYVLPPCFIVNKYPSFGKLYYKVNKKGKYSPITSELIQMQFPKSNYGERIFSIIDPFLHCDLAYEIANNWDTFLIILFNPENNVSSYSFPIPLDSDHPGQIGNLRSGRMIYEFIEMAENAIASEAYRYKFLLISDIKNFYPSIYTHALSWAIHNKSVTHDDKLQRYDYKNLGNRIDKLFQRSNDDCTNGIPIGPAVADFFSEILLSKVDISFSKEFVGRQYLAVRFKDDYRILCESEEDANLIRKTLQNSLREYNIELNESKTNIYQLPDGIFRPWVSRYNSINPSPRDRYTFKRFKEVFLAVVTIDHDIPGTGVVDRFLSDILTKEYKPNFEVTEYTIMKIVSLLLMLAKLRIKSFPRVLGIIESILRSEKNSKYNSLISGYLANYLASLATEERNNRYLIIWILYFLQSNNFDSFVDSTLQFSDPLVKSVQNNIGEIFNHCKGYILFEDIRDSAKRVSLLKHLDVFSPQ